jgi:(p)ppGpp synthase/HD superfamily hydrolase
MGRFVCPSPLQIISILQGSSAKILTTAVYANSKSFVPPARYINMVKLDVPRVSKSEFLTFLQNQGHIRIDDYIEGAIEVAEEVHEGLLREDGSSSFLQTHTWPVTMDVVNHYRTANRNITSVEIAAAILHDVMEDDDRILNLHESKSYGFEAYLEYRFGSRIHAITTGLKVKPLENYPGITEVDRQLARFQEYCDILLDSEYDVKAIKLADRLNNMLFISKVPRHSKIRRYTREAEDFYIAYSMLAPKMPGFYSKIRAAYEHLRAVSIQQLVSA